MEPKGKGVLEELCGGRPRSSLLVVSAHPGDEVLGAGSRLGRARELQLLEVTDGVPLEAAEARAAGFSSRPAYAQARREELEAALSIAGVSFRHVRWMELVDQQTSFNLLELTRACARSLREADPELILTHPYEGGHPDHDSTAFAVHAAARLLRRHEGRAPIIVEFTSYHGLGGRMQTGRFLPAPVVGEETAECVLQLTDEQRDRKRRMIEAFVSQRDIFEQFPTGAERYRFAPRYDFRRPPHPGTLLYERFPWGMMGTLWRSLAVDALRQLDLSTWG